jgi:hypothetical protein
MKIAPRSCAAYIQPHIVAYLSQALTAHPAGWFHLPCQPLLVPKPPAGSGCKLGLEGIVSKRAVMVSVLAWRFPHGS